MFIGDGLANVLCSLFIVGHYLGSPVRRGTGNMKIEDIAMMFSNIKRNQEERAKTRLERKFEENAVLFTGCSNAEGDADVALCTVEIFLMASLSILFFQQFWEFIALGRRYFLELESWFKMLIFSLVLTTLFFLGNPDVNFFC